MTMMRWYYGSRNRMRLTIVNWQLGLLHSLLRMCAFGKRLGFRV